MEGGRFPSEPPEDLGLSDDLMALVNRGMAAGELQVYSLTCEECGHIERRLENRTQSRRSVYCPNPVHQGEKIALRRTVAGW
jgi:hypothetical protein